MSSKVSRIYPHKKTRGEINNQKKQGKKYKHHMITKVDGNGNLIPVYGFETW